MLINVKISGDWAFEGIWVEHLEEGEQEMTAKKAQELIDHGRAVEIPEKKNDKKPTKKTGKKADK